MDYSEIIKAIDAALSVMDDLNPTLSTYRKRGRQAGQAGRLHRLQKVLVANRGEIAKRFFLSLHEEGIPSVAVVTNPDRGQSWYEFADEVVFIGDEDNYAAIPFIIGACLLVQANAIYSGYGFLSENMEFVEAIEAVSENGGAGIIFMGPHHETMRLVGNKMNARLLARKNDIPLFESSDIIMPDEVQKALSEAERIGYPVMVKPCSGGGGKGVYFAGGADELRNVAASTARIGSELFNDPSFYIEKYITNPVHIEVQIFNRLAIGIRKCAVQRRNQKIIEESGHTFLDDYMSLSLLAAAEKIAHMSGYRSGGAGTVEFLIDTDTGRFGFMEMNTRLQVEYAVTDLSLGIDIAKWQILYFDGREDEIIGLDVLKNRRAEKDHSIECRIYAEEPENDYLPSPGTIIEMDLPTFNGIRCDFGFTEGDTILPMYDPMIGKLIAHGATRKEALIRLERALQELYINGVKTNLNQLMRIVRHPAFARGDYTNNLLRDNDELNFRKPEQDRDGERRAYMQVIFGAFAEHLSRLQHSIKEFIVIASLGSLIDTPSAAALPGRYSIEYRGQPYQVDFIQTAIDTFNAYVDGTPCGGIILTSLNDRCDDFLLIYGPGSYRIRVNRHTGFVDLRMKDETNKINYFRMKVLPEGAAPEEHVHRILSPFQGTLVSFCRPIVPGDRVEAGEPLLILSSMKMETVIVSPVSGRIARLIEEGDAARLRDSRASDGRMIGRSLQEGELLAVIEPDNGTDAGGNHRRDSAGLPGPGTDRTLAGSIFRDDFDEATAADIAGNFNGLMELILAAARGFIYQPAVLEKISGGLEKIPDSIDESIMTGATLELLNAIISHYTTIKKLFSPVVENEGLSLQDELSRYIQKRETGDHSMSRSFETLIWALQESYGISRWEGRSQMNIMVHQHLFVLLRRAYEFSLHGTDIIKKIVHIIASIENPENSVYQTLARLMEQEQAERDDSLLKFIKRILSSKTREQALPGAYRYPITGWETPAAMRDRVMDFRARFSEDVTRLCAESLDGPGTGLTDPGNDTDGPMTEYAASRAAALAANYRVKRLFSPVEAVRVFLLEPLDDTGRPGYLAMTIADRSLFCGMPGAVKEAITEAARVVHIYRHIRACDNSWVDILVRDGFVTDDSESRGAIPYLTFKNTCLSAWDLAGIDGLRCIVTTGIQFPGSKTIRERQLSFYRRNDEAVMDLLLPMDRESPYRDRDAVTPINQRLLDAGKWPIETWAEESLDPGSLREIRIRSIDETPGEPAAGLRLISRPVGAKIYYGTIHGAPACYYMKDSRVSGGSTGSLEGLKYIAAAYLSYLNDWPLYVWNDSAGANIMEGIISLNRGAEGFMMNSLLTGRAGSETFRRYVDHTADAELRELFREIHRDFGTDFSELDRPHRKFQLTAVGIGSSAGLDVYGSSQASVQLLLDSAESYRVLTGSKVVHTVIGEDITNYDIGGAKILGTWTGIVDIVAADKLLLLGSVRLISGIFCGQEDLPEIRRIPGGAPDLKRDGDIIINETMIRAGVDDGLFIQFKENYYAAEALIGGFAKLGGRRFLIMGPRTHNGLRSQASITKARDLLRTAHRTGSHQIIIFGRKWQQNPDYHENEQLRPRLDLMGTMQKKSGLKIHLVCHPDGLKCFDINSTADIIIYVKNNSESPSDIMIAEKNATFIAASMGDAFDLAHRLVSLIDPLTVPYPFAAPAAPPRVPGDPGEPYDMIKSVICNTFDENTFLEFFRDMNNPATGPNLITGLAGLDGRTVGIIADQPLAKGGGADAFGTEKFRVFTEFLDRCGIPLVMLSNSSGFVPGSQQERYRIQAIGAESLDANILGTVPVVSVVLNQNYGGRLIHAFNKFLRPGIVYLALDSAVMAVIGVDAAFDLLYGKKYARLLDRGENEKAEELRRDFKKNYMAKARAAEDGIGSGLVDWTIPSITELRDHLIRGLKIAFIRCNEAFGEHWPAAGDTTTGINR